MKTISTRIITTIINMISCVESKPRKLEVVCWFAGTVLVVVVDGVSAETTFVVIDVGDPTTIGANVVDDESGFSAIFI